MAANVSLTTFETDTRSPCLPVAAALAAGIAIDHVWPLPRLPLYAAGVVLLVALLAFALTRVSRTARVAALLVLFTTLGGILHKAAWSDRRPDSITRLLTDEPRLVRLVARAADGPLIDRRRDSGRRAAWTLEDRTRILVEAISVTGDGPPQPVSGRIQLATAGHLIGLGAGDRLEVTGWLARPAGPRNPRGFGAAGFLRQKRIDALLYVDHPDAVRRTETARFAWPRLADDARRRLSTRFAEHLSNRNGPIGAAMILGDRSAMPLDLRDAYVASGAMHILAISGMNVGIFALFLIAIGRALNLPTAAVTLATVFCAWAYAILTDLEPPVVRAAIFLTLWALASLCFRRTSLLNTAAATALALLLWNPLLLFDLGAQLSFLAVLGMSWSARCVPNTRKLFIDLDEDRPYAASFLRWLLAFQLMSLGAWLFTAPLIAAEFGLVSPVGFLLNVLLIPLSTAVMWTGYAFFTVCLIAPWFARPFGLVFDLGLTLVNSLVKLAGEWDLGHFAVPALPPWWIAGCYALLLLGLIRPRWAGRRVRSLSVLLAWCAVGLVAAGATPHRSDAALRMTVLDVGHGGAVLLESADGRRLLVDCGSMEDDRRVAETVWHAVRGRGGSGIETVLLSHADLDHCNNLPALLRTGPVGCVAMPRSFLDLGQRVVRDACDAMRDSGTRTRIVSAGDAFRLGPDIIATLLHPPDRPPAADDNANSAVLRVECAGRTILITGDLEGPGQTEVFERDLAGGCDILVAPHHGGTKANTPDFAAWSRPRDVIVSCSDRVNAKALAETYPAARLHLTPKTGAVTVTITPDGHLDVTPFITR